ncbi:MAG TPA: RNA polymerase sigma factor [Tepidisphaeraceae bacterium]|jgi:RNA polymerase sigma-70 factor (ECF subfamily)|nr:RNA polymerase sigma factor [Tepidisphaeraceae bacterium]
MTIALRLILFASYFSDDAAVMVEPADPSDIRASLAGDGQAYARLIRRHQQTIAHRMRRFTRDRTILEELVHDVFVQAYFSLPRYRADAPFEHWLMAIATRVGYGHWKRQSRQIHTQNLTGSEPARSETQAEEDQLTPLLQQLSPRDRLVVTLLYLEEHSIAEAAALTGWSQTMVKVQAFRARGKLKKLMSRFGAHL